MTNIADSLHEESIIIIWTKSYLIKNEHTSVIEDDDRKSFEFSYTEINK